MVGVKISPKKCKIAMALAGHHSAMIIDHWLDFTNHNIQAMGKTLVPKNICCFSFSFLSFNLNTLNVNDHLQVTWLIVHWSFELPWNLCL